tara:strand:- start:322 stop:639 length:318 start_codon:yes stop_codon:yes gene_type:complete
MNNFNIKIDELIPMDNEIAIKWSDGKENYLDNSTLRQNCPCANCSGEKDVFGNVYIGDKKKLMETSYQISKITKIGHYAVRIFWMDGHSEGLYTFEFLNRLSNEN